MGRNRIMVGVAVGAIAAGALGGLVSRGGGAPDAAEASAPPAVSRLARAEQRSADLERALAAAQSEAEAAKAAARRADEARQAAERIVAERSLASPPKASPVGAIAASTTGAAATEAAPPAAERALSEAETARRRVDDLVRAVDWRGGADGLVAWRRAAREGKKSLDPDTFARLSRLNAGVGEISKALGLDNPFGAYQDTGVLAAFMPAWVDANGGALEPAQRDRLVDGVRRWHDTNAARGPAGSFLAGVARDLEDDLAFEQWLDQILTPEQHASYADSVGDDPFGLRSPPRARLVAADPTTLARNVTEGIVQVFHLGDTGRTAAERAIPGYVVAALAVPPFDPALTPVARRVESIRRMMRLVALERSASDEVAGDPRLDDADRASLAPGFQAVLELAIEGG